jgi:hypothetical protein
MDHVIRLLVILVWFFLLLIGSIYSNNNTSDHFAALDLAVGKALELQTRREDSKDAKSDNIQNEQKNQGLINTIVNHNNQLKNIDNKFNFIINNFANSSHVKEIIDRTNELEKHIVGAPRPHRSWREFLLFAVVLGALVVGVVSFGKKYCIPRIITYINKKSREHTLEIETLSKQIDHLNDKDLHSFVELKNLMEQHINKHNHQLDIISRKLNETSPTTG